MSKRSPKAPKKESLPPKKDAVPPPTVSSRLSSLSIGSTPTPMPPTRSTPTPMPLSRDGREPSRITTQSTRPKPSEIDDGDDDSDSDWNLEDDGIDDAYAEHLYDFFKEQKKIDTGNKALYTYIIKVFDDKEDFDEHKLDGLGIDRVIDTLSTKFTQYMKEDGGEESFKPLTKDILIDYLEAGLDDNFEDDGWIVKDE